MRVLLLSVDPSGMGGWATLTDAYCRELSRRGDVDFRLLVPRDAQPAPTLPYAERVAPILPRWAVSLERSPLRLLEVLAARAPGRHDLVHALVEFPYAIVARRFARQLSVPFGLTAQGTYAVAPFERWLDSRLYRPALEDASFVSVPSEHSARAIKAASGLNRPIDVIHNAVDVERFARPADTGRARAEAGVGPEARIILCVGALKARKGNDTLIRAFARVTAHVPDARLVIVGEGGDRPVLAALATDLGIGDQVSMPGQVPSETLRGLYQACEVNVLLSRSVQSNFEGFPLVYLEAGACGKPSVASSAGGSPEAVVDGETGLVVPEEDDRAAAEALRRLLQDDELRARLGANARAYAGRHTWEAYVGAHVRLYHRATSAGASTAGVDAPARVTGR